MEKMLSTFVIYRILNYLDDLSMVRYFLTYKSAEPIDEFWSIRIKKIFGQVALNFNKDLTFKKWYILLKKTSLDERGVTVAARENNLELLKWLYYNNIYPCNLNMIMAAHEGKIEICQWLAQLDYPILPNEKIADIAATNGKLKLLKWLALLQKPIYPSKTGLDAAADEGFIDILKFYANLEIYPSSVGLNKALAKSNLDILNWSLTLKEPIMPSKEGINRLIYNGHENMLELIKDLVTVDLIDQESANFAAKGGQLKFLKKISYLEILPNLIGANWAAEAGHLKVCKFLAEFKIYPDQQGANLAAKNGNFEVCLWLALLNIFPDKEGANLAAQENHLNILVWLSELANPIYPDPINYLQKKRIYDLVIFDWMIKINPIKNLSTLDINSVAERDDPFIFNYLLKLGIQVDSVLIFSIISNGSSNILQCVLDKNLFDEWHQLNPSCLHFAADSGSYKTLKILKEKTEISFGRTVADGAANNNKLKICRWLNSFEVPIYPTNIDLAAEKGFINICIYYYNKIGMIPSLESVGEARNNGHENIWSWYNQINK